MITKKVIVKEPCGLHARPASELVKQCQTVASKITICKGCEKADGCSILELLLLGAEKGTELEVIIQGTDEARAAEKIIDFFEAGGGI